ncbi:hypothetical protein DsansV1_C40g0237001 [Dioscorea sansibarensis]
MLSSMFFTRIIVCLPFLFNLNKSNFLCHPFLALSDLFAHYLEAWKSWFSEVTQGSSSSLQQPYKSIINQLS